MEIRTYTTGNILEFVSSEQFSRLKHIPITKHRALSYAQNPRASNSDKILFVAFEDEEVIGYLGAMPEKIFYQGNWKRMTWLSCFWVDPRFRGKNISKQLFELAMQEWQGTAMITNMKPGTLKIYERTGHFHPPVTKTGIRCYLRFNLGAVLPPRGGVFAFLRIPLQIVDFLLNIINAIRLYFFRGYQIDPRYRYDYVEDISPEAAKLIDVCNQFYLNRRGKGELEWINKYPWVIESQEDAESRRYYFSSVSKRFFYQQVEFRNENSEVVAFLMLSVRNNHLTVPYVFYKPGLAITLVKFLFNTMLDYQLNMLTVFHPVIAEQLRKTRSPFILKKKTLRPYFLPKTLDLLDPAFQDGDGDCAFT
jgi:GNAT superfamily N-acetyltransferase